MEIGRLEFVIAWVSIIGTILGVVLAAFGFLHRELRRLDAKVDEKFNGIRTVVTTLQVSVARIEGHLGIGFPAADEQQGPGEHPDCAA